MTASDAESTALTGRLSEGGSGVSTLVATAIVVADMIGVGVFTDFKLDELLNTKSRRRQFLDFIDCCAESICAHGSSIAPEFLNRITKASRFDRWNTSISIEIPLLGLGRFANLVCGVPPALWCGDRKEWLHDDLSRRMKQERITEHRRKKPDEQTDAAEP